MTLRRPARGVTGSSIDGPVTSASPSIRRFTIPRGSRYGPQPIGFDARSLRIDNLSGVWYTVNGHPVPAWTSGVVIVSDGMRSLTVAVVTPGGQVASDAGSDLRITASTELWEPSGGSTAPAASFESAIERLAPLEAVASLVTDIAPMAWSAWQDTGAGVPAPGRQFRIVAIAFGASPANAGGLQVQWGMRFEPPVTDPAGADVAFASLSAPPQGADARYWGRDGFIVEASRATRFRARSELAEQELDFTMLLYDEPVPAG